jgi:sporulation protein YlmC with PRC-barrel domain
MNYLDRDTYGMYTNNHAGGPGPRLMGADTLIGNDVYSRDEENLGDIKEIMLDTITGEISYAVLSYGGILGMGNKLFAVPWEALSLDTENKRFILDIDSTALESAPGFDKSNWPNMADETWAISVHDYYGTNYNPNISHNSNRL